MGFLTETDGTKKLIGPILSYNKVYDMVNRSVSHYNFKVSDDEDILIDWKTGFSKDYLDFLKENITVNPSPCHSQFKKAKKEPTHTQDKVDYFLNDLGVNKMDLNNFKMKIPSIETCRDLGLLQRIAAFNNFCIAHQNCWKSKRISFEG